jgi:UDP-N-acetylmuramate: L-alanyl-gamma-D-glutamyl-meso-diaminopimelate ligase
MRIHMVGVAGVGMGALAGLLRSMGHEVSGSDVAFDPPVGPLLERWGVACRRGYDPAHLEPAPDLVVIGNVCRRDNPLARAAIDRGLAYRDMAHALAELVLEGTSPLVVAGTHGKTTTSAAAAWLLDGAGRAPGFLVGGVPKNFGAGFRAPPRRRLPRAGEGEGARRAPPFVVEGDEYDSAFFEKTPKFWHYRPDVAVVTSVEHDHVDVYPDERSYLDAFRGFVARVPPSGLVVAAANDPRAARVVREAARAPVAWFALEGDETGDVTPEWLAAPAADGPGGQGFDLYVGGASAGRFALPTPGLHNVRNAVAAVAAAAQGYGAGLGEVRAALARFEGVRRRQELLGTPGGTFVYDDFAHHPTAVRETLAALGRRHPGARLLAAFEPRSATACRALHQAAYAEAFGAAARVVLAPLGRAALAGDALDPGRLAADLEGRGVEARAAASLDEVVGEVVAWARPGDVVAFLSNGAFGGVPARALEALGGGPRGAGPLG